MPEKVTREEKLLELAISKAKEVIQEAAHLGTLELDEDVMGEEVKVTRPKENPKEVKLPETSNIEGKENKISKISKGILKAPYDTKDFAYKVERDAKMSREQALRDLPKRLVPLIDDKLRNEQKNFPSKERYIITLDARQVLEALEYNPQGREGLDELENIMTSMYNGMKVEIERRSDNFDFTFIKNF